ncbi:ATP-binding cassette subfamily C member 4 [Leptinotarsa decemlineata]|uniref:ATP-binding cassette subfamily C member 4 n=1 Tax=Leptinotarsa decemlineata TaxID=7539 RepID=UPI003D30BE74
MDHSEKIERKIHPRERANLFSLLTFLYTRKIFSSGFKKDLEDDDLYNVTRDCKSRKCADKLEHSLKNEQRRSKPSTYRAMWHTYGIKYISLGIINLIMHLVRDYLEPEAISKLVAYFKPGQTKMTFNDALFYAGIMLGLKLLHTFYKNNYVIFLSQMALQMRTAFSSVIYRKVLRLSPKALENTGLGNVVNVITKDVSQFGGAVWLFNDLWTAVIQMNFVSYLIYKKIGISSFVGISILLSLIPLQIYIASILKKIRLKINKKTDERLQKTQEALSTIRTIKMYTWEKIFGRNIEESRKKETKTLLKSSVIWTLMITASSLVGKFAFYALIMIYAYVNEDISAETVFYLMRNFDTLVHTISQSFSIGFAVCASVMASVNRIDRVLQLEELEDDQVDKPDDDPLIDIRNVSLTLKDTNILKNITAKMEVGVNVLTGQLGCGKSSLIKVILKDYPIDEGELRTRGRKSYASQDPWLFPSTIKQNILFGEKYDYRRYKKVVEVCALEYDFKLLEDGDETIIADRGLNLSKGQQARVNLARAIYKDSDIYLIDDALTALDPQVQEHIYNQCIKGFLKDKLVLLVTHNAKHIAGADMLLILQDGKVKFAGKQIDISQDILEEFEKEDDVPKVTKAKKDAALKDEEDDESSELLGQVKKKGKAVYHEVKKKGKVNLSVYTKFINFGGGWPIVLFLILFYCISTFVSSSSQKMLSNWANERSAIMGVKETYFGNTTIPYVNTTELFVNSSELMNYTKELVSWSENIKLSEILERATDLGLNKTVMVALHLERLEWRASKTLNLYSILLIASVLLEVLKSILIMQFTYKASINLHKAMMKSIIHAGMSFFDSYFIGNILNRFSQDLNIVDEVLPMFLSIFIAVLFALFGNIGLIASISLSFILPAVILVISLVLLRFIYMPTARSLKRLEAATRSPLVGHLNSTIEGLTTIRAYRAQEILRHEYDQHQDLFSSASFTTICVKGAFSFYMEFIALGFEIFILTKFLFFSAGSEAGDVGLTLTQGGMLAMLVQMTLQQWSETENRMTSVERALEYTLIEPETEKGTEVPNWPTHGEITYNHVSLTYTRSHEKVLKDINFKVKPKEKIGIVGRTGAGKSSIVSTLFRLYNFEGEIFIDGVDTKALPLKFLRQHISIIPQDPIMFSGTIRSNVDPLHEYTDEEIWKTLHKVKLDVIVPSLETHVEDTNFSTGQRQLICLARAIIRKNKIVVLDEATANMDPETESIADKTVKENFASCTVFVIAHRLESILDCNKVMVLDRGQIAEYDDPKVLKEKPNGLFAGMLKNAGIVSSNKK